MKSFISSASSFISLGFEIFGLWDKVKINLFDCFTWNEGMQLLVPELDLGLWLLLSVRYMYKPDYIACDIS